MANRNSSLFMEATEEELRKIVQHAFNTDVLTDYRLISGGMFNTTYKLTYDTDSKEAIIRIGPVNRHLLMEFENNLMQAEAFVYELCHKHNIPCSEVLFVDSTKSIIDRDYMIVKYIDGIAHSRAQMPQENRDEISTAIGAYMKQMHEIKTTGFGRISNILAGKSFDNWYDAVIDEISGISEKGVNLGAFTEEERKYIISSVERHKALLDTVKEARLVHADLWDGNILVSKDSETGKYYISAIIDADRAISGDIDFDLGNPWMIGDHFLRGYGMTRQEYSTYERKIKNNIYHMMYFLIDAYVWYAQYNGPDNYKNSHRIVLEKAERLHELEPIK